MHKTQALLFVIILMFMAGMFGSLLMTIWSNENQVRNLDEQALRVVYLAQAGIERGKIAACYDMTTCSLTTTWFNDLDDATDNYTFRYGYRIYCTTGACPVGPAPFYCADDEREIIGVGEVLDVNNVRLAYRELGVTIQQLRDGNGDLEDDNKTNNKEKTESWEL